MKKSVLFLVLGLLASSPVLAATTEKLIQTRTHWNNQPIQALHIEQPQVTMLRITIPVGEKLPMHKHPILNIGYLTKGELTVVSESGEKLVLKPGDPIVELVNTWHYGESTGTEDAEIVVSYVGEQGADLSELKE